MTIKQRIEQDLKQALLGGDKQRAIVLRGVKSTILNAEIASGEREKGLSDDKVIDLLKKEVKSRDESANLYSQGGNQEKADQELAEKKLIEQYLPEQMSDEELIALIEKTIQETGANSPKQMGQVIAGVKQKAGVSADGARIAKIAKEKLGQ